jgi:hypothetical protein
VLEHAILWTAAPAGRDQATSRAAFARRCVRGGDLDVPRRTQLDPFAGASIVAVVAGGPSFVAVGTRNQNDAATWTSADGTEWEPVPPDPVLTDAYLP